MLDLILKLIDRCISLVKRREEIHRALFSDFVTPAFADFEAVHKGYIESFRKYRENLAAPDTPLGLSNPVFEQIQIDNLFSASDRAKLWELERFIDDPVLGDFILAIIRYIRFDKSWKPRRRNVVAASALTQAVRNTASKRIKGAIIRSPNEGLRKKKVLNTLDSIVTILQENYVEVVREYAKLKKKLLKTK